MTCSLSEDISFRATQPMIHFFFHLSGPFVDYSCYDVEAGDVSARTLDDSDNVFGGGHF